MSDRQTRYVRRTPPRLKSSLHRVRQLTTDAVVALRRGSAARRPLPDFLIIGAMKAGTTSLMQSLVASDAVQGGLRKEVHFFDLQFSRGEGWYRAHFPLASQLRTPNGRKLVGEATPYYLFHPCVPRRVAASLPGIKLLAILRNPVDRAISHYHHSVRMGFESESLERALALEDRRLQGQERRLLDGEIRESAAHQHQSYVARGRYADQLLRWTAEGFRDRLHVLTLEQLASNPEETLAAVFDFLGLPRPQASPLRHVNAARYAGIPEHVRRQLERKFRDSNDRLGEFLGARPEW